VAGPELTRAATATAAAFFERGPYLDTSAARARQASPYCNWRNIVGGGCVTRSHAAKRAGPSWGRNRREIDPLRTKIERPEDGPGRRLLPAARRLLEDLDVGATTLVHGDFHHHNLLSSDGRWVAIDPKPMLGEPEYDVAPFLWNPIPYRMRRDVTQRRLAAFAAAGLDEARIRAWAVIRASYLGADDDGVEVLRVLA